MLSLRWIKITKIHTFTQRLFSLTAHMLALIRDCRCVRLMPKAEESPAGLTIT